MLRLGIGLIFGIAGFAGSSAAPDVPSSTLKSPERLSPNRSYAIKLTAFAKPPSPSAGLLLKVRIDGGPPLRLLLDSGADSIVLDKRAAAKSGHNARGALDLVGAGSKLKEAGTDMAAKVEIGDLTLRNCDLIIVPGKVLDGVDGIIPLSLFAGFLVRLDMPDKTLYLQPYRDTPAGGRALPVRASRQLLFVKATINGLREGYMLLDTGAFYTALSEEAARGLGVSGLFASPLPLQGGAGAVEARLLSSSVHFRLGSRVIKTSQVVIAPLDQLERHHQMEIAGVLGYPALRDSVLTVNYRDGVVDIAGK
jgi:hypothetical protein